MSAQDSLPSDERFRPAEPLSIHGELSICVSEIGPQGMFLDMDMYRRASDACLDIHEARALRDWLRGNHRCHNCGGRGGYMECYICATEVDDYE